MIAVVFPGQGSQSPGMGRDLYEFFEASRDVFARVTQATSVDVKTLCFDTDDAVLKRTENAQLALYTVGTAAFAALDVALGVEQRAHIHAAAGHSVGEYAALAAAGVFSLEHGAKLVQERGRLMAESAQRHPGTMMAVLGLSRDILEQICETTSGTVVVANDNCPGQIVISGELEAVASAGERAKEQGAKRVVPLNVSGAFHSPLMSDAARTMRVALDEAEWKTPRFPVISNVTAQPVPEPEHWPALLERQLTSPVRWTESVEHMRLEGISRFIECGSGEVLSGLIRRIDKDAGISKVTHSLTLSQTLADISEDRLMPGHQQ